MMGGRALALALCVLAACEINVAQRADDDDDIALDPECGNGVVEGSEVCDDGNTADNDGCSATCRSDETCGNGVVDDATEETCDDGDLLGGDGCSADCKSDETCGNGVVDLAKGETCDDGDLQSGDGCSANCQSNEACGNSIQDVNEECDGGTAGTAECDVNCTTAFCGDGTVNGLRGEQCEDGNGSNNDGCVNCRNAICGDGFVRFGVEQCDGGPGCNGNCQFDPRVYFVTDANSLVNQAQFCDGIGESRYEFNGAPIGFSWQDSSPFMPSQVTIEWVNGINCVGTGVVDVRGTTLNGVATGNFDMAETRTFEEACVCQPSQVLHSWTIPGGSYAPGQVNTFTMTGSTSFGFSSNLLGAYARITVFP